MQSHPRRESRRSWLGATAILGTVALALAVGIRPASAKTSFESPYTLAQTYNAALRMVRVDLGLAIKERDPAAAYLIFDYRSHEGGDRAVPGSIEMLETGHGVRVVVQLAQMPRYHEQVMSDALTKKLRDEYGEPTPHGDKRPAPDAGDVGPSPGE